MSNSKAKPWEHCREHGPAQPGVWACPTCLVDLRRWKSTHAPRLEALQALLETAQREAAEGVEARATLASEREANARLTAELEEAQRHAAATDAALSDLRGELWEERRQHDITRGVLEMVRSARDQALAEAGRLRLYVDSIHGKGDIQHHYRGLCPDDSQPDSRDDECPACQLLRP